MKWLLMALMVVAPAPKLLTLQQVAEARVKYMADRNYRWHPPYHIANPWRYGARFEGCGWGRRGQNPKTIGTCMPRRRMTLAADASATGRYGTYRLRLWK